MTPQKKCSKCCTEKPLSEFYENRHVRSGYFARCKTCVKGFQSAWNRTVAGKECIRKFREENPDKWIAYNEAYGKSKKGKESRKKYKTSVRGKEVKKKYLLRRYGGESGLRKARREKLDKHRTPEKAVAWDKAYRAIQAGKIIRVPCTCGNPNSEAHHEDYSKPLDVIFLCASCHQKLHYQKRLMDLDSY
jgi:hypothetical protein